jgi:hypothetical protein
MRRLLILTAAATLIIASAATTSASARTRHHHYRDANASTVVPDGAIPADTLNGHDAYIRNLHDSGYNPHSDFDARGIIKIY